MRRSSDRNARFITLITLLYLLAAPAPARGQLVDNTTCSADTSQHAWKGICCPARTMWNGTGATPPADCFHPAPTCIGWWLMGDPERVESCSYGDSAAFRQLCRVNVVRSA